MSDNRANKKRVTWAPASVAIVLTLVFGALIFAYSQSASRTLDEAAALHVADMSLAAQDVAMKSIAQLVLLGQDQAVGSAGPEDVGAATIEAEHAIEVFIDRTDELDPSTAEQLGPSIDAWLSKADEVVAGAESDQPDAAAALLVNELVPRSKALAEDLVAERDGRAVAVDDAGRWVGTMAQIAGFLTALLLPLLAMATYRQSMKHQLDVAQAHLDARLDAERSVGRAKDQFIANISHELRTPLTSIYGFSEVLLDQGFVDPTVAEDLVGLINTESAELARMVEDLLVAAHDDDAPLAVDVARVDIVDEIEAVLEPFRRRDIAIGGTYAPATVLGDRLRIRQVLRNLVANAVQHGGPTIRVFGDVANGSYFISVEDDGPGVPDTVAPRLFTRFVHQGEAPLTSGSVGLGLAVAHLLSEAMGGSLEYERITGRTCFVVSLPLAALSDGNVELDDLATTRA
jgi:signal transduction histidine kinase